VVTFLQVQLGQNLEAVYPVQDLLYVRDNVWELGRQAVVETFGVVADPGVLEPVQLLLERVFLLSPRLARLWECIRLGLAVFVRRGGWV